MLTKNGLIKIAELREIKNARRLSREDLICTLLRSEKVSQEDSYLRHASTNTDSELGKKIRKVRLLTAELGDALTKINKKRREEKITTFRDELYRLENAKLTPLEKEKDIKYLNELINDLSKQKYTPILVRSSFKKNFEEYEIRADKDKDKNMLFQTYLNTIIPYLKKLIDEKKLSSQAEQKIRLIVTIIFKHLGDLDKKIIFYVSTKNIEMCRDSDTDEILNELIESLLKTYKKEESVMRKTSNCSFDYVELTTIQFHSIELKRGSSYTESPNWLKNKRVIINPKNFNNDKCFQYSTIAALHHQDIAHHPKRISNLTPYINNYKWDGINFSPTSKDKDRFERNNPNITLNILSVSFKEEKIVMQRKSEYNEIRSHSIHLLMITDGHGNWHYLATKNINGLMRGFGCNHYGDKLCLNCMHSFRTGSKLEDHKRLCNDHDYCKIFMPTKDNNLLQHIKGNNSLPIANIICYDL